MFFAAFMSIVMLCGSGAAGLFHLECQKLAALPSRTRLGSSSARWAARSSGGKESQWSVT